MKAKKPFLKQGTLPGVLSPEETVREFLRQIGSLGGKTMSPAKLAAIRANSVKANIARRRNAAARRAAKAAEGGSK